MTGTFKQTDIKPCGICGKGIAHDQGIMFYRVRVEPFVLDAQAIERQIGMEKLMGGNAAIAFHMGPQENMATALGEPYSLLVCGSCMLSAHTAQLITGDRE